MTLVMKRRQFRPLALRGTDYLVLSGVLSNPQPQAVDIAEHQMTWSEGHPWPKGSGIRDTGGPFETIRTRYNASYDLNTTYSFGPLTGVGHHYIGNVLPVYGIPNALRSTATEAHLKGLVPSLGDSTLGSMGATAISNVAPTSPTVDGSVAIAELYREGLPSLVGSQLFRRGPSSVGKNVGSEFLNFQFGILPIWSDIRKTAQAVITADTIIRQLLRDSGKNVRRRYDFPPDLTNTESVLADNAYPWPTLTVYHWTKTAGATKVHTKIERSVWFEGCFTYYLSPQMLQGWEGAANEARLIYGLEIGPNVAWNLMPWSWLIDWLVNVGPVMENMNRFARDDLTLRYGYTMEHTRYTQTTRFAGLQALGSGATPKNPVFVMNGERKIRRKQSPFVLGLTGSDFTLRRAAILTALGMTKF